MVLGCNGIGKIIIINLIIGFCFLCCGKIVFDGIDIIYFCFYQIFCLGVGLVV